MKTKIWVGVLFYSFMGCANKAPKSNLTSKSIPKEPEGYGVRYIPVQEEPVEENTVYEVVEEMPEFPGGIDKLWLSGNFWLVSFKISYLCLPLFYETRTTPSCHPSGCAYRQL